MLKTFYLAIDRFAVDNFVRAITRHTNHLTNLISSFDLAPSANIW